MYEGVVQELIDELGRLPGVGPKSAQRIAFHLLQTEDDLAERLARVLIEVKERVRFCEICGNVSEQEKCNICRDERRSRTSICVVEESKDVQAIERTREFRGLYHVLGGAISPIEGIGPDQLRIKELMTRTRTFKKLSSLPTQTSRARQQQLTSHECWLVWGLPLPVWLPACPLAETWNTPTK